MKDKPDVPSRAEQRARSRCSKATGGKGLGVYRFYQWQAKKSLKERMAKVPRVQRIAVFRLAELERLFKHRYGLMLPDDDAGRDDIAILISVASYCGRDRRKRMEGLAARWAPWLSKEEVNDLVRGACLNPHWLDKDLLGFRTGLTLEERTALSIGTFGCIELPDKEARERHRRDKDNEKRRQKRREERARIPERATVAELAQAEGISRATYYRRHGPRKKIT